MGNEAKSVVIYHVYSCYFLHFIEKLKFKKAAKQWVERGLLIAFVEEGHLYLMFNTSP